MRTIPIADVAPEVLGHSVGRHLLRLPDTERNRFLDALRITLYMASLRLWMHVTRRSVYEELFRGTLQMSGTTHDMSPVTVYRSLSDGSIWVRKTSEFMDGRFEEVTNGEAKQEEAARG